MSNISISENNVSRYIKRAHKELTQFDPSLKLSQAGEIFARILGNANFHELQDNLHSPIEKETIIDSDGNERNIYKIDVLDKDASLEMIRKFTDKSRSNFGGYDIPEKQETHPSHDRIDELFAYVDSMPFITEFEIVDDNKIFVNLHWAGISIPLRFGKFKDVKYKNYEGMQAHMMNSTHKDAAKQSVFDFIEHLKDFNSYFNNEHLDENIKCRAHDIEGFKYFVTTLMNREYNEEYAVNSFLEDFNITYYDNNGRMYQGNADFEDITTVNKVLTIKMQSPQYGFELSNNVNDSLKDKVLVWVESSTYNYTIITKSLKYDDKTSELTFLVEDVLQTDKVKEKYARYL